MTESVTLRSNGTIFIRALQSGHPVAFRGDIWKLIKAGDDIVAPSGVYVAEWDVLVTLGQAQKGNVIRDIMMPCDIAFNDLMRMCRDMSDHERIDIVASQVLMSQNSKKGN